MHTPPPMAIADMTAARWIQMKPMAPTPKPSDQNPSEIIDDACHRSFRNDIDATEQTSLHTDSGI